MSERMALLGGQLHVDSSPGVGTTIIAELMTWKRATAASEDRTPP